MHEPALSVSASPGIPNSPRDTALAITAMAFGLASAVLFVPPLVASVPAFFVAGSSHEAFVTAAWATIRQVAPLVPSFQVAVTAFAVLLLTLFVEEGLHSRTSDQAVRRNVANFAFWGAAVTTAMCMSAALVAASDVSFVGQAVVTVGAGVVVLFFASHLGTRGVAPLAEQRKRADALLETALRDSDLLSGRPTWNPRRAGWMLSVFAGLVWLALPGLCAGLANVFPSAFSPSVWLALGICWAMVATLVGTFAFASLPDTPRVFRWLAYGALALSGLGFITLTGLLAYGSWESGTPFDRAAATALAALSFVFVVSSLPAHWLPRSSLSAILWSVRIQQVSKLVQRARTRVHELESAANPGPQ